MARQQASGHDHRLSTDTRFSDTDLESLEPAGHELPALTILAHPEAGRVGEVVVLPELSSGEAVGLSRLEPLFVPPGGHDSPGEHHWPGAHDARPLADPHVSRKPLRLVPTGALGEIRLERGESSTPVTLDGEPLAADRGSIDLARGAVIELGRHTALWLDRQPPVVPLVSRYGLVGDSGALWRLRREIERAARLSTPVLLRGASGTGKELVARALHDAGPRRDRPFVAVNMAAVPPALAAAELFGARKGAFTGADRHARGFFAAADGGTLFLDEIGDTPPEVQPLLLRALESGEIQAVGSTEARRVDVRVIAATDADLEEAIAAGRFRPPLLHRLAGWEIRLPSLAERRADVGRLLVHFVAHELGKEVSELGQDDPRPWASAALMSRLARHDWLGNVRQLMNVARRLAVLVDVGVAALESHVTSLLGEVPPPDAATPKAAMQDAPSTPGPRRSAAASPTGRWRPVYRKAAEIGDEELIAALREHRFDVKATAAALGVSRPSLYRRIERCPGLRTAARLSADEIRAAVAQNDGDVEAAAMALGVSVVGLKQRMKALGPSF